MKPAETQTIASGQLAIWSERLYPIESNPLRRQEPGTLMTQKTNGVQSSVECIFLNFFENCDFYEAVHKANTGKIIRIVANYYK